MDAITYDELLKVIPAIHLPFGIDVGTEGAQYMPQVPATRKGRTLVVSRAHADDGLILKEAIQTLQACKNNNIPLKLAPPTIKAVLLRRDGIDKAEACRIARQHLIQYSIELLDGLVDDPHDVQINVPNSISAVIRPDIGGTPEERITLRRRLAALQIRIRWLCVDPTLSNIDKVVSNAQTANDAQAAYMMCVHILIKRLQDLYQALG